MHFSNFRARNANKVFLIVFEIFPPQVVAPYRSLVASEVSML